MAVATRLQQLVDRARSSELRWDRSQERVTAGVLLPSMPKLIEALGRARAEVDREMRAGAAGHPWVGPASVSGEVSIADYPVGFCHVIRDGVRSRLRDAPAWKALARRGVVMRDIFVILKGRYFQNALQVGNLYVDAANDTVDPSKHWLEWAPVRDVDFENPMELGRFAQIAASYYGCSVHPNTLFPEVAPVLPILAIRSTGRIDFLESASLIFLKDLPLGLPRFRAWVDSGFPGTQPLPVVHREVIGRMMTGCRDGAMPFEFRPSDAADLLASSGQFVAWNSDPSRHQSIVDVLDRLPRAMRSLKAMQAESTAPGQP